MKNKTQKTDWQPEGWKWQPEDWQWDPERLTEDPIQIWNGGNILTISLANAKKLVADKTCFVSTPYMITVLLNKPLQKYGLRK